MATEASVWRAGFALLAGVLAVLLAHGLLAVSVAGQESNAAAPVLGAVVSAGADDFLCHVRVHALHLDRVYRVARVVRGCAVVPRHTALFILTGSRRAEHRRAGAATSRQQAVGRPIRAAQTALVRRSPRPQYHRGFPMRSRLRCV